MALNFTYVIELRGTRTALKMDTHFFFRDSVSLLSSLNEVFMTTNNKTLTQVLRNSINFAALRIA
jgi:hypothetical protein